jgi:hypothetical protein
MAGSGAIHNPWSFVRIQPAPAGGGWFDDAEEVLEVRSGVIQLLIAPVLEGEENAREPGRLI